MNEDSQIIMSNAPHEVHIPEGSKTAVHKTAQAQAPVVRNTDVDVHAEVEHMAMAQVVSVNEAPVALKDRFVSASETRPPEHQVSLPEVATQPDEFISDAATRGVPEVAPMDVPSGVSQPALADTPPSSVSASAVDPSVLAQTQGTVTTETVADHASFMEEMNFPARVVKLKIDNDKVRLQMDKLEKPLFPPVVETAPAAKGKDKEQAAKKPAKGH